MINGLSQTTRDGAPSVAFLCEDREQFVYGAESVDAATAAAWAKANAVKLDGPGSKIARINSARYAAGLPSFIVVQRPGDAPIMAKPAVRTVAPIPSLVVAPLPVQAPGPRTIKTQEEFLDLVTDFDSTLPGLLCTSALAGFAHDLNTHNRPMQPAQVDRFCRILETGQWMLTGEAVVLTKEGTISDGQHRLRAIQKTGISALLDFRFGIAKAAFAVTGTGTRRTTGNILAISGRQHASAQAAIARLLHHYDAAAMARSNQQVEASLVLQIVEREPHLPAIAAWMSKAKFAPARTAPVGLVLAVAARLFPMERVLAFANLLESGVADDTNPARLLHVRLRDAAMAKERLHQTDVAALAVKAFNAWVGDRSLHHLKLFDADRASETFPRVIAS